MRQTTDAGIRFDRVPPQDIDAERALLGSLIVPVGTRETIEKAKQIGVLPEIFYKTAHEYICVAIYNLYEKESPVDLLTLTRELLSMSLIEQVGDVAYLDELLDSTPTSANMAYYAEIVLENALKRAAIRQATKLYNDCFEHDIEIDFLIKQHNDSLDNLKELYHSSNGKTFAHKASDIVKMDIPDPKWIVKNYIPEGLSLISGPTKAGKSWLMLQLALATAQPGNIGIFLGILPVENSGNVLYLALEDSLRRIKSRLLKICKDNIIPEQLEFATDIPFMNQGGIAKLENWIQSKANPRLIIVDVLEKIRDHGGNKFKNAYEQDYEDLGRLKKLADKTNVSIVVVDHRNKSKPDDILDTITGSVGKQGAPDGLLILKKPRKEKVGTLYRTGKDYDEDDEMAIELDLEQGIGWSLIGNANEHQLTEQRKAIIELLETSNEPMSPKQIAEGLDVNAGYIRTTLRRLIEDKTIKQFGYGKYIVNQNK
jgi:hypothetical protein